MSMPAQPQKRKNMTGEEREQQILEEAVRFFAEVGFEGQTRELAKRLSITHAAIYRHFPSKDALIERVYEHVYTKRWRTNWETLILDRTKSLEQRMVEFYLDYADCVFEYEWVRIFISSGMKSYGLPQRYLAIIRNKIIIPAAAELRFQLNQPEGPITEEEEEVFWGLHGSVFYIAIRKFIYDTHISDDIHTTVANTVCVFFKGLSNSDITQRI